MLGQLSHPHAFPNNKRPVYKDSNKRKAEIRKISSRRWPAEFLTHVRWVTCYCRSRHRGRCAHFSAYTDIVPQSPRRPSAPHPRAPQINPHSNKPRARHGPPAFGVSFSEPFPQARRCFGPCRAPATPAGFARRPSRRAPAAAPCPRSRPVRAHAARPRRRPRLHHPA